MLWCSLDIRTKQAMQPSIASSSNSGPFNARYASALNKQRMERNTYLLHESSYLWPPWWSWYPEAATIGVQWLALRFPLGSFRLPKPSLKHVLFCYTQSHMIYGPTCLELWALCFFCWQQQVGLYRREVGDREGNRKIFETRTEIRRHGQRVVTVVRDTCPRCWWRMPVLHVELE